MPDIKTWSVSDQSFSFAGGAFSTGRGDDAFIEYDQPAPNFSIKQGIDGEVTRNEVKVSTINAKLYVMQTSIYNDFLSGVLTGDIAVPGGAGIGPILYKDNQGRTMFAGLGFITKPPAQTRKKEVDVLQWDFIVVVAARVDGGN